MSNQQHVYEWCLANNWTEPRKLNNGAWVAFPPGGVIETPLPIKPQLPSESRVNPLLNLVYALILIFALLIVGAISILISPLFLASIVRRHRKRQSMS